MKKSEKQDLSDVVLSLLKKRGFIWGPSPELYGGLSGFYDFGPLGKLVKNKIENLVRKVFVRAGYWEVECPTVSPRIVWEASGHVEGFIDPVTKCKSCGSIYRADNLIEEFLPNVDVKGKSFEEMSQIIREHKLSCPSCGGELGDVVEFHLMMRTTIGLDKEAFLRPETATTTYLLFKRLKNFFRDKFPFKVFQIGKAYRNEISPRQGVLRLREFTQVEGQMVILENQEDPFEEFEKVKNEKLPMLPYQLQLEGKSEPILISLQEAIDKGYLQKEAYAWSIYVAYSAFKEMGFKEGNIRLRQHLPTERAHYAKDAWDIEIISNRYGWIECCGIHDRGNYDLSRHQKYSKESLSVKVEGKPVVPNILEIAFGIERPLYCALEQAYREEVLKHDKKEEIRVWLDLPVSIAPIDVAVFPLMNKPQLRELASKIYNLLVDAGIYAYFDVSGSIGKRYRRMDEIGTPYSITIDFDSLEDNTVTIRDRNTMSQKRVKISNLVEIIENLRKGRLSFTDL